MKYVLIGAVVLWIALDVGSGLLMGLSKARHDQLAAMPMAELLETVAETQKRKIGDELILHSVLTGAHASGNELVHSLKLTRKTKKQTEAKWSRGFRSTTKYKVAKIACGDSRLRLLLARGATVVYRISDKNDVPVLRIPVRESQCS